MLRKSLNILAGVIVAASLLAALALGSHAHVASPQRTACGTNAVPPCTAPIGVAQSGHLHLSAQLRLHNS